MILAAIVAGGTGTRMGGELPKQFMTLHSQPVLICTIECFLRHPSVDAVIVGVHPDWIGYTEKLIQEYLPNSKVFLTHGGINRNETIVQIISFAENTLRCSEEDIILSHDAARPFVTERIITDSLDAVRRFSVVTAAIPETDTIAFTSNGTTAESFPDRSNIFRIQTPQTFTIGAFKEVYHGLTAEEKAAATDVCSLFHQKSLPVGLIAGDHRNIKLTFPSDMQYAQTIL